MVFLFNYLYSVAYTYLLGREYSHYRLTNSGLFFLLLPLLLLWLIISGGQDSVGTDYESYMYIFEGNQLDYYMEKHEYLFAGIISLFNTLGIYGQALFYIFYAINFLFLFLIIKRLPVKQFFLFIILYITVTSLFNNQLNTLRQATAIYIGTYVAILIFEKKYWKGLLFILVAIFIHQSALVLFMFYVFNFIVKKLSYKFLLMCLLIAVVLSLILKTDSLEFALSWLSDEYAWYFKGGMVEETGMLTKVTKYIFIPIYFLAWCHFRKKANERELLFFKLGWISFCLRISVMNLSVVNRLFDYFLILSIFPLLLYLSHLYERKRIFLFLSIVFFFSLFYCVKVTVFAHSEYLYDSVYF